MRPGSPKPQIDPDRRPEALPEPIPADQTALFRPEKRKMTRQDAALQTPGRPDSRQVPHQQSQVESTHVDQQSLAYVGVAPDEDPAQPARGELGARTAAPSTRSAAAATVAPATPGSAADSHTPVLGTSGSSPSSCAGPDPVPTDIPAISVPSIPEPSRCCGIPGPSPLPGPGLPTRPPSLPPAPSAGCPPSSGCPPTPPAPSPPPPLPSPGPPPLPPCGPVGSARP